jgi:hypothetical protein
MKRGFDLVLYEIPLHIICNGSMVVVVIDDGTKLRVEVGANIQKLKSLSGRRILGLY